MDTNTLYSILKIAKEAANPLPEITNQNEEAELPYSSRENIANTIKIIYMTLILAILAYHMYKNLYAKTRSNHPKVQEYIDKILRSVLFGEELDKLGQNKYTITLSNLGLKDEDIAPLLHAIKLLQETDKRYELSIFLSGNKLSAIDIPKLTSWINLSRNQLRTVTFPDDKYSLKHADLSHNQLAEIDVEPSFDMRLILHHNLLKACTLRGHRLLIGTLSDIHIKLLDLSSNRLTNLNTNSRTWIDTLQLQRNLLTHLNAGRMNEYPMRVRKLLDVSHNKIRFIDPSANLLFTPSDIVLSSNPFGAFYLELANIIRIFVNDNMPERTITVDSPRIGERAINNSMLKEYFRAAVMSFYYNRGHYQRRLMTSFVPIPNELNVLLHATLFDTNESETRLQQHITRQLNFIIEEILAEAIQERFPFSIEMIREAALEVAQEANQYFEVDSIKQARHAEKTMDLCFREYKRWNGYTKNFKYLKDERLDPADNDFQVGQHLPPLRFGMQ